MKWLDKLFGRKATELPKETGPEDSNKPWADIEFIDGQMKVNKYNKAFVEMLKQKFGDLIGNDDTDDQIVQLFIDRENLEREEPKLEIIHSGIEADGRLKIQLDWNKSFIEHLKKHGITGDTEEEAIEAYLSRLTSRVDDEQGSPEDVINREHLDNAYKDIENELQREFDVAESMLKNAKRSKNI